MNKTPNCHIQLAATQTGLDFRRSLQVHGVSLWLYLKEPSFAILTSLSLNIILALVRSRTSQLIHQDHLQATSVPHLHYLSRDDLPPETHILPTPMAVVLPSCRMGNKPAP